ncbi:MAG: hypothetical protein R6T99_09605 [Bacteroidales bacterium]
MASKPIVLSVSCPKCRKSLMDNDVLINNKQSVRLNIAMNGDRKGNLHLSSIYGDFSYTSNIPIKDGEIVNFICPYCKGNLKRRVRCELCDAPIVSFTVDIGGRVSICSRKGCKNHYMVFEDIETVIRKFYIEFGDI